MATLSYLTAAPNGANWNTLLTEFDRRLTVVLDGRTPLLLGGRYGWSSAGMAGWLGAGGLLGQPFIFGATTGPYYLTAQGDGGLEPFWKIYDHAALTAIAAAATELSRDAVRQVLRVATTGDTEKLEGSLQAHTRVDGAETFWLGVGATNSRRPLRRHRHAVAEVIVEGVTTLEWPAEYDRYENVRVHNLNDDDLTVWVHGAPRWSTTPVWVVSGSDVTHSFTAGEDGRLAETDGTADLEAVIAGTTYAATAWAGVAITAGQAVVVRWVGGSAHAGEPVSERAQFRADLKLELPRFGCRAFRRTPNYLDASLNYFWKFRAAKSRPRFLIASGAAGYLPERSAAANPVCRPHIVLDWLTAVGAELDPTESCDQAALFPMFTDPATSGAKWRDCLHHTGPLWSVAVGAGGEIIHTKGRFNGYATLATDLAPLGVNVSEAGDGTVTLSRASGAPGVGSDLDLVSPGTNLLHYEASGLLVPREYQKLPFSLATVFTWEWSREVFSATPGTAAVTLTYLNLDGSTNSTTHNRERMVLGDVSFNSVETVSLNDLTADTGFGGATGSWQLTPSGWQRPWTHTVAPDRPWFLPNGNPVTGNDIRTYDDVTGSGWTRRGYLRVRNQGWPLDQAAGNATAYGLRPDRPRTASGFSVLAGRIRHDPRFDGESMLVGVAGGGDLVPTVGLPPVIFTDYAKLRPLYLSQTRTNGSAAVRTHTLFTMPDQVWASLGLGWTFNSTNRNNFQNLVADTSDLYFLRLPIRAADFNLLAWHVNAWRRSLPLIAIVDVMFASGGVVGTLPGILAGAVGGVGPGGDLTTLSVFNVSLAYAPKDCCAMCDWGFSTYPYTVADRQAWCDGLGLVPLRLADMPGYVTAAAAAADMTLNQGEVKTRKVPGAGRMEVVSTDPPWTTYRQVVDEVTVTDENAYRVWEFSGGDGYPQGQFGFANKFTLPSGLRWWRASDIQAFAASKGMAYHYTASGVPVRLRTEAPVTPTRLLHFPATISGVRAWPNPGGVTEFTTRGGPPAVNLATYPEEEWQVLISWPDNFVRWERVTAAADADYLLPEAIVPGATREEDPLHAGGFTGDALLSSNAHVYRRTESIPTGVKADREGVEVSLWGDARPDVVRDTDLGRVQSLALLRLAHDPTGKLLAGGGLLKIPDGRVTYTADWWSDSAKFQKQASYWPRTWTPAGEDQVLNFTAVPCDGTLRVASPGAGNHTWNTIVVGQVYLDLS
jgi:hypothetical protein